MSNDLLEGFAVVPMKKKSKPRRSEPRISISRSLQIAMTKAAVDMFDSVGPEDSQKNVEMYFNASDRTMLLRVVDEPSDITFVLYINRKNRGGTIPRSPDFFEAVGESNLAGARFNPMKYGEDMLLVNLQNPLPTFDED